MNELDLVCEEAKHVLFWLDCQHWKVDPALAALVVSRGDARELMLDTVKWCVRDDDEVDRFKEACRLAGWKPVLKKKFNYLDVLSLERLEPVK